MSILKKFKLYVEDNWNKCDMVAISLFVVGVSCRWVILNATNEKKRKTKHNTPETWRNGVWGRCRMTNCTVDGAFLLTFYRMVNDTYEAGRTVLAIDFMVFTLRLIHIFAIHKQLGPKIIIVERMVIKIKHFYSKTLILSAVLKRCRRWRECSP